MDDDILAPFAAGRYGETQTYHGTVDDRLHRGRAALKIPRLQKTVVAAIERRIRRIGKEVAQ